MADELLSACHWLEKPFRNRREDFIYSTSEPAEDTFTIENRAILDMMKSIELEAMYLNLKNIRGCGSGDTILHVERAHVDEATNSGEANT